MKTFKMTMTKCGEVNNLHEIYTWKKYYQSQTETIRRFWTNLYEINTFMDKNIILTKRELTEG